MDIVLERTRIIISDFSDLEKKKLATMVATMDKVFYCEDEDYNKIYIAPGLIDEVRKKFPKANFRDNSQAHWPYAAIDPVVHSAEPRNQLQVDFINFLLENSNKGFALAGVLSTGVGKAVPSDTKIPTPSGYKLMREIKIGDYVFGSDGCKTKVIGVYPQGVIDVYKMTFCDGRTALCSLDHQWAIKTDSGLEVTTTEKMLEDHVKLIGNRVKYKYTIPSLTEPVQYEGPELESDPYLYGYGLNIYDENSFILDKYKYSSIENRVKLLKGIFSAYGKINILAVEYAISIHSKSKRLLRDIQEVVLSLGYLANVSFEAVYVEIPRDRRANFFTNLKKLDDIHENFFISKKIDRSFLTIKKIEKFSREECQCISVEAEDNLYLTENFIVTHNTFMACYSSIKVGQKTLIIAPTSSIKQQWADTLTGMFKVPKEKVKVINKPTDFFHASGDFVVISHASLASLYNKYNLEELMKKNNFGVKVIDEVQMWFHNILKIDSSSNICNNWYITGTFGRSGEEENALYQRMFSKLKIFREKEKPSSIFNRNPGNIYGMKPHMHTTMVWTKSDILKNLSYEEKEKLLQSWKYSETSDKWSRIGLNIPRYTNYVIPPDGKETKFLSTIMKVIELAHEKVKYGKTLVLVPTIAAVNVVFERCKEMYPDLNIGTVHSKNTPVYNSDTKKNADMIISTAASAGTGFDCPGLSRLINAQQVKSWILTDQISGRLRRRPDGQDTYLWDIVDATIPQLRAWAKVRAEVLKKKSKSFTIENM